MSSRRKGRKGPRKEDFSTQKALKSFLLVNTKTSEKEKNEETQHSRNYAIANIENPIRGSSKRQFETSISSPSSADNSIRSLKQESPVASEAEEGELADSEPDTTTYHREVKEKRPLRSWSTDGGRKIRHTKKKRKTTNNDKQHV